VGKKKKKNEGDQDEALQKSAILKKNSKIEGKKILSLE